MTCFLPNNEDIVETLNALGEQLSKSNLYLVILTASKYEKLNFLQIRVPFSLKNYAEAYPHLIFKTGIPSNLIEEFARTDICWTSKPNTKDIVHKDGVHAAINYANILLEHLKPSVVLLWSSTLSQSILYKSLSELNGIPTYIIERGLLPDTLMIETVGHGGYTDLNINFALSNSIKDVDDFTEYDTLKKYYLSKRTTKYDQSDYQTNDAIIEKFSLKNKKIIVFFLQNDAASGIIPKETNRTKFNLPLFDSMSDAVAMISDFLKDRKEFQLIVKPHPTDLTDYSHFNNSQILVTKDIHINNLFEIAELFIGVSSTVLFEAIFYEKPILLLGNCQISNKGCAYEPKNSASVREELEKAIGKVDFKKKLLNTKRFMHWVANYFLIKVREEIPVKMTLASLTKFLSRNSIKRTSLTKNKIDLLVTKFNIEANVNDINGKYDLKNKAKIVSIIIPVFGKIEYTRACIDTVLKNTFFPRYEIIIVDNGSTDGTAKYLTKIKNQHNHIRVVTNKDNMGFAKANNQGAKIAVGEYILCLNNDTEAHKNWLSPMVDILEADSSVGAVGSKLLFPDGTIQHAGVVFFDDRQTGGDDFIARHIYYGEDKDFPEANEMRSYQTLTGACLLIRKIIFDDLNGFDEKFWNGYEDIDLCLRIREKGYKLIYQPNSILNHYESKSGPERFSKVQDNIDLLNKKWRHKIVHDVVRNSDGKPQLGENHHIRQYKVPIYSIEQLANRPLVSIIILTYNALKYTKKCVESIKKFTQYPHEIIFVDNASRNDTVNYLNGLIDSNDNYKLIENKENRGFAGGNNQGVEAANGEYVLLLNNDVMVSDGWLSQLVSSLEKNEKIGMVGPVTNTISGWQEIKSQYKGDDYVRFSEFIRSSNEGKLSPRRRLAGFAVLLKRSLYQNVKGLDESFGAGNFEDDDFSLKIREKGYALMVDESVFIHHYGSRTFKENKIDYLGSLNKRLPIFYEKWPNVDYDELIEVKNPLHQVERKQLEQASGFIISGEIEKAKELLLKVMLLHPISQDAFFGLALCSYHEKDNERALKYLEGLLTLNPNHADALNQIGLIAAENGDLKNAQSLFISAVEKDPNFIDAQRNLAESFLLEEEFDKGVQMYMSILAAQPDDIPTLLRMAQLHHEAGNEQESRDWANKVLAFDSQNMTAQNIANV